MKKVVIIGDNPIQSIIEEMRASKLVDDYVNREEAEQGTELSNATFSTDGKHRFELVRIWDKDLPVVAFVGLNPSTANAESDDPTIRSIIRIAKFNGFGGVRMLNLYTIVSSDPKILVGNPDNNRPQSDMYMKVGIARSEKVVAAWGNFKEAHKRAKELTKEYSGVFDSLGKNKDGSPKHPLYIKTQTEIILY